MKKIVMLCVALLLSVTALQGCASGRTANDSRFLSLELEINRVASRIDRLDSKLDMLSWSMSPLVVGKTTFEIDPKREQMEKLVVDMKAQVSRLKEQLAARGVQLD